MTESNRGCGTVMSFFKNLWNSDSRACVCRKNNIRNRKIDNSTNKDFKWVGLGVQFPN